MPPYVDEYKLDNYTLDGIDARLVGIFRPVINLYYTCISMPTQVTATTAVVGDAPVSQDINNTVISMPTQKQRTT